MIQSFITSMIGYCIICFPIYGVARFFIMKNEPKNIKREIVMLLFFLYCVSIFSQTIIPQFWIENGRIVFNTGSFIRNNFVPFETISMYIRELQGPIAQIAFYNLAGNIVLFIPFGFFIALLWPAFRSVWLMIIVAMLIPLFIEGTQLFIGRSVDIDDVFLNAIAIFGGYQLHTLIPHQRAVIYLYRK